MQQATYVIVGHHNGRNGQPRDDMPSDKHPLLDTLYKAGFALGASALILLATLVVWIEFGATTSADDRLPMAIPGKAMQAVVGGGEVRGERLAMTANHPDGTQFTAVAVWRGRFQAADYPLLRYQIDGSFPDTALTLIWRTSSNPQQLYHADMHAKDSTALWLYLAGHPDWQGTVEELGVYVFASSAGQVASIDHMTLEPLTWRGVLASQWFNWTSYRGWSAQSINLLYGTADRDAPSPVLVGAAWSALAIALLLIAALCGVAWQPGALAAVLLLPWISLDMLWQQELMSQLGQTRQQFAGKTAEQKHLAAVDAYIYRYVMRLKKEVLPDEPARIAILHSSNNHNFDRLKAQYYLLPHNVYNFGRFPPKEGMDSIDFLLVLGDVAGLEFQPQSNTLVWKLGDRSLAVERVDRDSMGGLYRVLHGQPIVEKNHD